MIQCAFPRTATIWKKRNNLIGEGVVCPESSLTSSSSSPVTLLHLRWPPAVPRQLGPVLPQRLGACCTLPAAFSSDMPKARHSLTFLRSLLKLVCLPLTNTCNPPAKTRSSLQFTLLHPCKGPGDAAHTGSRHQTGCQGRWIL